MMGSRVSESVRGVVREFGRLPGRMFGPSRTARRLWHRRVRRIEQLLIVPPDLRSGDPGFAAEVAEGAFGIAGCTVRMVEGTPFSSLSPSPAWERELHGFGWLRNCSVARSPDMAAFAREQVLIWIEDFRRHPRAAWRDDVLARRVLSWIAHAETVLDGASEDEYDTFMQALAQEIAALRRRVKTIPAGLPRLLACIAMLQAYLALPDADPEQAIAELRLTAELEKQLLGDGGHVSRNPAVLIDLLLDLVPLRQCFVARRLACPEAIHSAVRRILPMLRHLRLGDGSIARFNGMGVTMPDALATALAYDAHDVTLPAIAPDSRYGRLEAGGFIAIMDLGATPPMPHAAQAHAGCLGFELSAGRHAIFLNAGCGVNMGRVQSMRITPPRATASHSALVIGESSSASLVARGSDAGEGGSARSTGSVEATFVQDEAGVSLDARHGGYAKRFGLLHKRNLSLSADGQRVVGVDRLEAVAGATVGSVPCAIHFHLQADIEVRMGWHSGSVVLTLPDLSVWRFECRDAALSIEESIHHAVDAGSRRTLQIVLRRLADAGAQVRWSLQRVGVADNVVEEALEPAVAPRLTLADALAKVTADA